METNVAAAAVVCQPVITLATPNKTPAVIAARAQVSAQQIVRIAASPVDAAVAAAIAARRATAAARLRRPSNLMTIASAAAALLHLLWPQLVC